MTSLLTKKFLVASCAALLLGAAAGGAANAQSVSLPGVPVPPDTDAAVQQLMLTGGANAVSQFLGISSDQLHSELVGHSLAEVAKQHGQSASDVTTVVIDTADRQLDGAVNAGQLAGDAAAKYKTEIAMFAPMLVNSKEASALALQAADG